MKFLIDAQLPPSLVHLLKSLGCEAEHVEDVSLRSAGDEMIRGYAASNGSVLVTKDRDFIPASGPDSAKLQIVWVRTGNVSNRKLFERLTTRWPRVLEHLESGAKIVELR